MHKSALMLLGLCAENIDVWDERQGLHCEHQVGEASWWTTTDMGYTVHAGAHGWAGIR